MLFEWYFVCATNYLLTLFFRFSGQVILVDGSEVRAKQVLSNATPAVTFLVYSKHSFIHT